MSNSVHNYVKHNPVELALSRGYAVVWSAFLSSQYQIFLVPSKCCLFLYFGEEIKFRQKNVLYHVHKGDFRKKDFANSKVRSHQLLKGFKWNVIRSQIWGEKYVHFINKRILLIKFDEFEIFLYFVLFASCRNEFWKFEKQSCAVNFHKQTSEHLLKMTEHNQNTW